ncbi:hypothetical protein BDZ85DRAFT_294676 [Elsinoe ampelina]|uniref:FAD-binding domain-containing protein n=1 Tax=Elsinoe ampelina TaxID=302913 RepID=A0A6A6GGF7_9PEZI|nr:hypothetical protein BDZ85DRAFT_294676 [Elsinoe ampelina]
MSTKEKKIKVAIIGGGIGGLSLAAGLVKQAHVDVHVYESVPEYKDIGAGLALHMNAIKAMDQIGPHVKKAYFEKALTMAEEADEEMSTQVSIASGPNTGAVVAELGKAKGRKTVARSDLLAGLKALIPSHRLHFNKRLESIHERPDDTIDITFKDGRKKHVDCLIAYDGVHSTVRTYLLGADHPATHPKNHDGWQIYRTMLPTAEAKKHIDEKYTRSVPILCGPKGHINIMPLHRGKDISAGVAVRGARSPNQTTTPPLRPEDFTSYSPSAQAIVRLIALDTSFSWAISDHDPAPFYSRRRICLAGDAAHTSLPFAGQGAAQALEDAAVLTALFKDLAPPSASTPPSPSRRSSASSSSSSPSFSSDDDPLSSRSPGRLIPHLFAAYDHVRRPRSQKVVDIARDFGRLYGFALPGYRDDPEKMRGFFGRMARFTNDADIEGQNSMAVERFWGLVRMEEGGWGVVRGREGGGEEGMRGREGEEGLGEGMVKEERERVDEKVEGMGEKGLSWEEAEVLRAGVGAQAVAA